MHIQIKIYEFGGEGLTSLYHSDVIFYLNEEEEQYVAFGPGNPRCQRYNVVGEVKKRIKHDVSAMSDGDFRGTRDDLIEEWNAKDYNLFDNNCNHFADAVLKRFGHDGLPGAYFSRGDHVGKQVWNMLAQGVFRLSPAGADNIGKAWCTARDDVADALSRPWGGRNSVFRKPFG